MKFDGFYVQSIPLNFYTDSTHISTITDDFLSMSENLAFQTTLSDLTPL